MSKFTVSRFLIASGLLLGTSAVLAPVAIAATDNGVVSGTVDAINNVTYTPPAGFTLNPTTGNTDQSFGSVVIQDNSNAGWTLTVDSANSSNLNHATYGNIAYTGLEANGPGVTNLALDVSSAAATIRDVSALTCADAAGCTYTLTADIASGAIDSMAAGVYTDTLTFTLTSK